MHTVFVASLVGGAVATALFALLGMAGGGAHGGHGSPGHTGGSAHGPAGHAANGHDGGLHVGGQHTVARPIAASFGWALSWLSPLTIAAAAVWFGGIGLIAEGSRLGLLIAIVAAIVGAALIRGLFQAFVRAGTPPLQLSGDGAIGTVNAAIRADAPGEVIYTLEGLHRSVPARSTDGTSIPRGTAVVITRREGGFAWVEPLDPLEGAGYDPERSSL